MYINGISSTYDFSFYSFNKSQDVNKDKNNYGNQNIINYSDRDNTSSYNIRNEVKKAGFNTELSDEQRKEIEKLKNRDTEVKRHEEAHRSTAGALASTPKYTYKSGPDGKQYAVGGSVDIDTSKASSPEATIAKAALIRRSALAPKNPSKQDMKIAQEATKMEAEARQELSAKRQEALKAYSESKPVKTSNTINKTSSENNARKIQPGINIPAQNIQNDTAYKNGIQPDKENVIQGDMAPPVIKEINNNAQSQKIEAYSKPEIKTDDEPKDNGPKTSSLDSVSPQYLNLLV